MFYTFVDFKDKAIFIIEHNEPAYCNLLHLLTVYTAK